MQCNSQHHRHFSFCASSSSGSTRMQMSHHHRTKPKPSSSSRRRSNLDKRVTAENKAATSSMDIHLPPPNVIARLMGLDAIQTTKPPAAEAPPSQAKCSSRDLNGGDSRRYHCLMNKMRASRSRQRRRHPQEDLLQKIRHDFQAAWHQAASSHSSAARPRSTSIQMVAQENLRKQKMARYGLATATTAATEGANPLNNNNATTSPSRSTTQQAGDVDEELLQPTPILLLKPGTGTSDALRPLLFGLPKVKRDANMSRFLEEVKGMLHQQLKADAANQTRQSVAKDKRFFRSESFRGFRSDRKRKQQQQASSPEQNIVRIVTRNQHHPLAHTTTSRRATPRPTTETIASQNRDDEESVSSSCSITGTERVRSPADVSPPSGISFGEQSFRSECLMKHKDDSPASSSARALFRSFSAPELGFSFSLARLFGDGSDRSTMHGVVLPSQGAAATTSCNNNTSAFGFIRGTVSSLRRNLFRRRKTHWSRKTSPVELHPQMAIGTAPPSPETFDLFKVAQANLTELPPSPVSPLQGAGHSCRHFLSELNCILPELSPKCLSEFEAPCSELSYRTDVVTVETACDQDRAYIREVLVAAGLYLDDNKGNGRVDSMARLICDDIFEEVEDMYYYRGKYCDDAIAMCSSDAGGSSATDHRMLFDLANEALQSLVQQGSSLRQWILDSTGVSRGRTLVDDVWHQVQTLRNPQMQEMQTIDSMVAHETRKSAWAEVLYEDVYVVGRKIERAIFDELIEDLMI